MQTANSFTTQDATAPPKRSPLTYGPAIVTLVVPDGAVQLTLSPTTTLKVSEDPELNRYCLIASGAVASFDVASVEKVYLQQYALAGVVNFRFATAEIIGKKK